MSTTPTTVRRLIGVSALAAILAVGCSTADPSTSGEHPPVDDFDAGSLVCTTRDFEGPVATGTLTNNSSKTSNYMISVNFTDANGVVVASGTAINNNIPPATSATWEAITFADGVTYANCNVVSVDRFSAVG